MTVSIFPIVNKGTDTLRTLREQSDHPNTKHSVGGLAAVKKLSEIVKKNLFRAPS